MNLLESIFRNCEAEEYIPSFKQQEIDAFTLKILGDEDLQILGITEENKRKKILEQAANLQVAAETHSKVIINEHYINLILNEMSAHLNKHAAILAIVLKREDVLICDVKLLPATKCLQNCVYALEGKLNEFKTEISIKKQKSKTSKGIILCSILLPTLLLAFYSLHRFQN